MVKSPGFERPGDFTVFGENSEPVCIQGCLWRRSQIQMRCPDRGDGAVSVAGVLRRSVLAGMSEACWNTRHCLCWCHHGQRLGAGTATPGGCLAALLGTVDRPGIYTAASCAGRTGSGILLPPEMELLQCVVLSAGQMLWAAWQMPWIRPAKSPSHDLWGGLLIFGKGIPPPGLLPVGQFCAVDDSLLCVGAQFYEIGAVSRHAHQEIAVVFGCSCASRSVSLDTTLNWTW